MHGGEEGGCATQTGVDETQADCGGGLLGEGYCGGEVTDLGGVVG